MKARRALRKFADVPVRIDEAAARGGVYMGGTEVLTRLYNDQKMYVDTRDISETPHLILDGHWEIDITRVFERLVVPGEAAIDIGATYGYYGMIAGKMGASTVVCVDPNPVYGPYLTKNLTVNGLIDRSFIDEVAIGAKKGKTELLILQDDWASSTIQSQAEFEKSRDIPYTLDEKLSVSVTTVDALVDMHKLGPVGVIKLDIEGFEEAAYPAMKKVISNSPNLSLLLEFSPENYKNAARFYADIEKDFEFMYVMPSGRDLTAVSSYKQLQGITGSNWMMLVASTRNLDS